LIFRNNQRNWFDRKVKQFKTREKQPIKTINHQVIFLLLFETPFFSKGLKPNNLGSILCVDYKFKLPKTHPETHNQSLQAIHIDLETSKPMFNNLPYLMKTNPWFACVDLFEFESTYKKEIMHVPDSNHIQVSLAAMNQFSPCDFHKRKPSKSL